MIDIQQLIDYDKKVFLVLNGSDSLFWDGFMWIFTSTVIWIPLAVVLLYIIVKNNRWKEVLLIISMIALTIFLCDRISSGFFKPFFHRFRPTQEPAFMYLVDIVNGYRGGRYGFISSHAANTFGLFVFLSFLFKKKEFTISLFFWAVLTSYSRIYLGVHYAGDILAGALFGSLCGGIVYLLYYFLYGKLFLTNSLGPSTCGKNYWITDLYLLLFVLFLSYFSIFIIGMIYSKFFLL